MTKEENRLSHSSYETAQNQLYRYISVHKLDQNVHWHNIRTQWFFYKWEQI